ncbi:hypothetical protein [Rufibacter roseolus]|uniref:hypothetical protein n=1 Tax=Rufibacter roseolus TaxID=2817375 RepID=UPI001B305C85|nr:hypothetical protein [Rufibacter roseolus]
MEMLLNTSNSQEKHGKAYCLKTLWTQAGAQEEGTSDFIRPLLWNFLLASPFLMNFKENKGQFQGKLEGKRFFLHE